MSAAAQITVFLLFIILTPILLAIAGFVGWLYWRERRERRRQEQTVRQAELYRRLSGAATPAPRPRRKSARPAAGGNVFIVSGSDQRPDDDGWRVLR